MTWCYFNKSIPFVLNSMYMPTLSQHEFYGVKCWPLWQQISVHKFTQWPIPQLWHGNQNQKRCLLWGNRYSVLTMLAGHQIKHTQSPTSAAHLVWVARTRHIAVAVVGNAISGKIYIVASTEALSRILCSSVSFIQWSTEIEADLQSQGRDVGRVVGKNTFRRINVTPNIVRLVMKIICYDFKRKHPSEM